MFECAAPSPFVSTPPARLSPDDRQKMSLLSPLSLLIHYIIEPHTVGPMSTVQEIYTDCAATTINHVQSNHENKDTKGLPEVCRTFQPKDYVVCFEPTHLLFIQQILTAHPARIVPCTAVDVYRCGLVISLSFNKCVLVLSSGWPDTF